MPFFSTGPEDAKRGVNWTMIISIIVALGAITFGVQQCHNNSITQGDIEARADSLSYWKDQAGTEHAKVGQLVTSQAFVQKQLDSIKTIPGAKVVSTTTLTQHGNEVLRLQNLQDWIEAEDTINIILPKEEGDYRDHRDGGRIIYWRDGGRIIHWDTIDHAQVITRDTAVYSLTAADTLDWLRHNVRTYSSKWDTARVTFDSIVLTVNDKLHIVETQVKEGGLFNRRIVPYVDVYHENPMLRTTDLKAWRVSTPIKHWAIGPAANFYPKFNNGIKFGASFGISVVYGAITF